VLLGGGGIPSESGLMRSYRVAEVARHYPNAAVAVAMTDSNDVSTVRMLDELAMRGVKRERILLEDRGRSTREQAVNLHQLLYADGAAPVVLVVTSPEHMRRALGVFRKAGFQRVSGAAADARAITANLNYHAEEMGETNALVPDVGQSMMARYGMWNNLLMTGRSARELVAIVYYRMMGWM
jgi:uncharacterized SAM-binding protein YcdF (DUF218 family)